MDRRWRLDAWRALGAAICLVTAAVMCALLITAAWALAPMVADLWRRGL